jgi:endonuclease/exonuclease/phosphatase family metal-dependent hydrolase
MPTMGGPRRAAALAVLVGLAALGCSSGGGGGAGGDSAKASLSGQVLEWNLSGWSLSKGATAPADRLVQEVNSRGPAVVAVVTEETCSAQYDRLRAGLSALGFSAAENWSLPSFGQPGCASFGNAVFWRGQAAPDGVQRLTYPAAVQAQGAATQEQRNLLCASFTVPATTTTAATPLRVCGTHLYRDPRVAARQAGIALSTLDERNRVGPPTLLLGDLNLTPTAVALNDWYARYTEGDLAPRSRTRPTTTGKFAFKYDYGFVPTGRVDVPVTSDVVPEPNLSDHAIYALHFAMR